MSPRIFIENPPPFKKVQRRIPDQEPQIVEGHIEDGLDIVRYYRQQDLPIAGFHHSDIDPYESRSLRGNVPLQRFGTFEYTRFLKQQLTDFDGLLIPHRVGVYQPPDEQAPAFRSLQADGVRDVVIVGKPSSNPGAGITYQASVPDLLAYLSGPDSGCDFTLGVIGIHLRPDEPDIIARKFRAAGGRLRVMGQFLDECDQMVDFIGQLARTFEDQGLDLGQLEYNVGLAIFGLKNQQFYAGLLRKDSLDCASRFEGLEKQRQRLTESLEMNLEFAERILEAGRRHGVDIGFSVQPLIEHKTNGDLHPAVKTAAELAQKLSRLQA